MDSGCPDRGERLGSLSRAYSSSGLASSSSCLEWKKLLLRQIGQQNDRQGDASLVHCLARDIAAKLSRRRARGARHKRARSKLCLTLRPEEALAPIAPCRCDGTGAPSHRGYRLTHPDP